MLVAILFTDVHDLWRLVWLACEISSGRGALACVRVPVGVAPDLSARARRLMRQAQVSAW